VGEAYLCDACGTPFDGAYYCPKCRHNTATKEPVYTAPQPQRDDTALLHQCFEVLTGPTCHQSTQWARLVETLAERLK
jgi:hypothetical protein